MEKLIFDYIDKKLRNDIDISISYEDVEKNYNLKAEDFQQVAKYYSQPYGYNYKR